LIIAENDVLEGILSIKDLLKFIKKGMSGDSSVTLTDLDKTFSIEDMMTKNPIVLSPEQDVNDARELLSEGKFSALPVVKDGLIVGIISIKDVIRFDNTL
jgi:acetoin utilization protein AcuB